MRLALTIVFLGGGAAIAGAAGIVVWNLSGPVFVHSRPGANPTLLPFSR